MFKQQKTTGFLILCIEFVIWIHEKKDWLESNIARITAPSVTQLAWRNPTACLLLRLGLCTCTTCVWWFSALNGTYKNPTRCCFKWIEHLRGISTQTPEFEGLKQHNYFLPVGKKTHVYRRLIPFKKNPTVLSAIGSLIFSVGIRPVYVHIVSLVRVRTWRKYNHVLNRLESVNRNRQVLLCYFCFQICFFNTENILRRRSAAAAYMAGSLKTAAHAILSPYGL